MLDPELSSLASALADRYVLERELGAGGMATVYLARDLRHGRPVAVKVLRPELAQAIGPARFLAEIQLTARLQHPHIVPLYDSGEAAGQLFYVMPYVAGESLRARLAQGPLPLAEAAGVLSAVARALAHAHGQGVVHRDIKPDNVLLAGGMAVVSDFGIAKALSGARSEGVAGAGAGAALTQTGLPLGTPAYMAPEQVTAEQGIDHRADLYAWGCVAYEVLTGQPPFAGSAQRILAGHLTEEPGAIGEARRDLPPELAALVMQCLAKEPAARPPSAAALLEVLGATSTGSFGPPVLLGSPVTFARAALIYLVASAVVVGLAAGATRVVGLPAWVVPGAVGLIGLGLPALLVIGSLRYVGWKAALATPSYTPGGSVASLGGLAGLAHRAGPRLSWGHNARLGVAAVGGFGLLTTGYMLLRVLGIGPAGTLIAKGRLAERPRLLVTEMVVQGADTSIGPAVTFAVSTALGKSRAVTLASGDAIELALERMRLPPNTPLDLEVGRRVALREGIPAVVAGHVLGVGGGFDVGLRLITADSGIELWADRARARSEDEILDAVDALTRGLRAKIGESLRSVNASAPLPRVTTRSLEALKLYQQSGVDQTGDWGRAVDVMERAVQADSEFAEGWRRLAIVMGNAGMLGPRRDTALARALRYSADLPEVERLHIEGSVYANTGDRPRAAEVYERLLALGDPNTINFAELLYSRREFARAESLDRRFLEEHPDALIVYGNLASRQIEQGKLDEAERTLAAGLDRFPNAPGLQRSFRIVRYLRGDLVGFERALDTAPPVSHRDGYARWRTQSRQFALVRGRLREWSRILDETASAGPTSPPSGSPPPQRALTNASVNLWVRGDTAAAVADLERTLRDNQPRGQTLLQLAAMAAAAGRPDLGRQLLKRFEAETDAVSRNPQLYYRALAAHAQAEGHYEEAIASIRRSDRAPDGPAGSCGICVSLLLAEAFDLAGEADSARRLYEEVVETPYSLRLGAVDQLHLPRVLRRLGELHEAAGNRERAVDYYTRFVTLWEGADAELQPQVREVRRRIAGLAQEPAGVGLPLPARRP